jgi:hypothetical protein
MNYRVQAPPFSAVFRREASPIVSFQRVAGGKARNFRDAANVGQKRAGPPHNRTRHCGRDPAFHGGARRWDAIDETRHGAEMGVGKRPIEFGFPWILSYGMSLFNSLRGLREGNHFQRAPARRKRRCGFRAEPLASEILAPGGLSHAKTLRQILLFDNNLLSIPI